MANRENELFIGKEFLNIQGRDIKHPALIKYYASLNIGKISDEMLKFIGLDLETNHKTSELKLLGFWNGNTYKHYTKNFIDILFQYVKYACDNKFAFAWWNKLDPTVLYKQFLFELKNDEDVNKSMERFGKITGEWSKKEKYWKLPPVVEISYNQYKFGIVTAVRSSVKFFYYDTILREMKTCWAYDIAGLYEKGLEQEAEKRLPYYTKVSKEAHLVNWDKFKSDKEYRENVVLRSNMLDARAVYDLAIQINEEFKRAFKYYPTNLVSQGSFARSALVAVITDKYSNIKEEKERKKKIINDLKSINLMTHIDKWIKQYDRKTIQDMYQCIVESYSAGYIETIRYGYTKEAWYADIASAYPAILQNLYDLTGATITTGNGVPPNDEYSYCFIRGLVDIPINIQFNPITIKHYASNHKETNIRAVGKYYCSYTLDERKYLESQGAKFTKETWFNIKTKGKLSSIADVTKQFVNLRLKLIELKDSAQYSAKIASNSLYGIQFEAVPVYELNDENEIIKQGYRAGEFFNPLYATIITARTRIMLAKASQAIEDKGGEVILLMTDSIMWKGSQNMLPKELFREKKTLGYFEKPEKIIDLVCIGSGRYSYKKEGEKEIQVMKKRGLNITEIHDPTGAIIEGVDYLKALQMAYKYNLSQIEVNVRVLVSVGMVLHNKSYTVDQLGLVTEERRKAKLIVGWDKRIIPTKANNLKRLLTELIKTNSLYLDIGYNGKQEYYDASLPVLRNECNKYDFKTRKEKKNSHSKRTSKRYYEKNKKKVRLKSNGYYKKLREAGYSALEAKKYSNRSKESIEALLNNKLKPC